MNQPVSDKILLFSEIFPPLHGGSGRWFYEIYNRFPSNTVVFLVGAHEDYRRYDTSSMHKVLRLNLGCSEWGIRSWKGAAFYLRLWRHLRQTAKDEGIRRIHCGRVLHEGFSAFLLKKTDGVPYSCYVHGEDVESFATSRELTWMTRRVLNGAEKVISNSYNTQDILTEKWGLDPAKIFVMHPGVDVKHFSPRTDAPTPEGWLGRTVVLTVGRLQKRKGHDMMIRAMPTLVERWPNLLYAVVGEGEELSALQSLVARLGLGGHVQFMGAIDDKDLANAYRNCTLFALPNRRVGSDDEGFGMVLLEAQACGKPILAGNSGGTRETMIEGQTGVLVDCNSPESVGAAVINLLEDNERLFQMGLAARKHVENRFSWENLAIAAQREFL